MALNGLNLVLAMTGQEEVQYKVFTKLGMKDEDIALYTGFLRLELHQTKSFILVERIQLNELLNDKKYDRMGCNSSDCAVEIGNLVGIKKVISG